MLTLAAAVLGASCSGNKGGERPTLVDSTAIDLQPQAKGDSTVYGLACEGCTDSIVIFLPNKGGDPDTFEIIDARRQHKIFGRPKTGDKLAIMINPDDGEAAATVINIDDLSAAWCYMAEPRLRDMDKLPKRIQRRMAEDMPDSVRRNLLAPREFGFELKRNYTARPIGMMAGGNADGESPVEYPAQKMYEEWRIYNGKILLIEGKNEMDSSMARKPSTDTADIVMLRRDSLILKFGDGPKSYYRKR